MKRVSVIIVGTGATAELVHEYLGMDRGYKVVAFSAEKDFISKDRLLGLPVVPLEQLERSFSVTNHHCFIAVSHTGLNRARKKLYETVKVKGYPTISYIHPSATVAKSATVGENCLVLENCTIQPFVKIGNDVVVCSGSQISHGSVIEDHAFLAASVTMGGYCKVGESCFLGLNSTVCDCIHLSKDCVLAAGSVVIKHAKTPTVYRGNPALDTQVPSLAFFKMKEDKQ